jgi:hypothetical protein
MENASIKVEPGDKEQVATMEKAEPTENTTLQSTEEERLCDFECVMIKIEPEDDEAETGEDGDTLTTAIEEHQVKVEIEEEQSDMICGWPAPDTEMLDQPRDTGKTQSTPGTGSGFGSLIDPR